MKQKCHTKIDLPTVLELSNHRWEKIPTGLYQCIKCDVIINEKVLEKLEPKPIFSFESEI